MATRTVEQARPAPVINIDEMVNEATAIAEVLKWVVQANEVLEDIRHAASVDEVLTERLRVFSITYGSPEWHTMSDSIAYLTFRQRDLIIELGSAAGAVL